MAETATNDAGTAAAFRRLGETQAAHAAGDAMVAVALADTLFFAVPVGEARHQVALYLGLTMAPFAVLSPVVGPWLDRRRGFLRLAIVIAAVGRAALAVLSPAGRIAWSCTRSPSGSSSSPGYTA